MEQQEHHNHVEIFIDKKRYESPNPTTGAALYKLGGVDPNAYDLYEEVHGKGDDKLIGNDNREVHLKNGGHFFTVQKKLNPGSLWR
jgi:Multiubiquitin